MAFRDPTQATTLFADDDIIVAAKPPGVPTGHVQEATDPSLVDQLEAAHGKLWTVHRLDIETSGVIVFARNAEAHRTLSLAFEGREVEKVYHCLVRGVPRWEQETAEWPLRINGDRRYRTVIDERQGKPAHTDLAVLERFRNHALIEARIHTGRRHQVRAHLDHAGYPPVADSLYGQGEPLLLSSLKRKFRPPAEGEHPLIARTALHAWRLAFTHPASSDPVDITAPYPSDFATSLKQLRRWAPR